ncbi:transcriptional regulator [Streptomyces rubellomurinus subsp. indigoferus]|uniref:Transcriptional regulator n=1 Tax=Streptomyces rubellomurinus (strain ATCC 31215) TaxID=359131 RepID=A0A0F2TEQ2_STRR3|nr:LCP family protein [Streptomyces rubellomurinus]KJS53360.1 transcriptional regulator [Streptomyces rubellomurinus subsp. indigoferus]KJS60976.1 transcriptional regulator [Streptomyces rubellomurinus]
MLWVTAGITSVLVLAGGAIYYRLNSNITTFDGDALSKDRPEAAAPDAQGRTPVNVLLIGSDSRGNGNSDLGGGGDGGARSDTAILLHVYADHKHAVGISIPRDSLVTLPPCKLPNGKWTKEQTNVMFNSAFSVGDTEQGNPACTQNAVEKLTNLRVDHTIVVDFNGFASMTKAVGGVEVCLPNDIHEGDLNPNLGHKGKLIFAKGKQKVEGQQALDYVRIRHGIGDGSDIGRTKRQQAFLSSLIKEVKSRGMDPTTLLPLADAGTKSLTVDPDLGSAAKLISFAMSIKDVDLHDVKFLTAPWRYEGPRVALVHPDVDQLWAALKADRTIDGQDASAPAPAGTESAAPTTPAAPASPSPAAPPDAKAAEVKVTVLNGTGGAGLAGKAAEAVKGAGYTSVTVGNASGTKAHATTLVEYGSGEKSAAEAIAKLFPGSTVEPGGAGKGVSVVIGRDFAAANPPAASGAPGAPAGAPAPLPTSVAGAARSADDDPCANISYG